MKKINRWKRPAWAVGLLAVLLSVIAAGQNRQMIVYGEVRYNMGLPPPGAQVHILREDLSIVRTVPINTDTAFYSANIFSSDGFETGDAIFFSVLFSPGDSIIARTTPRTVRFQGNSVPYPPPIERIDLWNNHTPEIISAPDTIAYEDSLYRSTVVAVDADTDTLLYTLLSSPSWLHIDSQSGVISGIPSRVNLGDSVVIVEVNDEYDDGKLQQQFTLHVLHTNHSPRFTRAMPDTVIDEGTTLTFQYYGADSDDDLLTYSIISGPDDAALSSSGLFSWLPDFNEAGVYTIVAALTDGNIISRDTAAIRVVDINHAPSVTNLRLPENGFKLQLTSLSPPLLFRWTSSQDFDGDSLRYTLIFSGPGFDTTVALLRDTALSLPVMSSLRISSSYWWTVMVTDSKVKVSSPDTFVINTSDKITGVTEGNTHPWKYALMQNYPNPFNPTTEIKYQLSEVGHVSLKVYDILGKEVATLVNGVQEAGEQQTTFAASNFPSGMYFYTLRTGNFVETKKMVLVK